MLAVHASMAIAPRVRASAGSNGRVARAILRAPQKIVVIGGATNKRRASVVVSAGEGFFSEPTNDGATMFRFYDENDSAAKAAAQAAHEAATGKKDEPEPKSEAKDPTMVSGDEEFDVEMDNDMAEQFVKQAQKGQPKSESKDPTMVSGDEEFDVEVDNEMAEQFVKQAQKGQPKSESKDPTMVSGDEEFDVEVDNEMAEQFVKQAQKDVSQPKSAEASKPAAKMEEKATGAEDDALTTAMNDWIHALPEKAREKLVGDLSKCETEEEEWMVLVASAKADSTKVRAKEKEALIAEAGKKGFK
jgi:hypothetical protein